MVNKTPMTPAPKTKGPIEARSFIQRMAPSAMKNALMAPTSGQGLSGTR